MLAPIQAAGLQVAQVPLCDVEDAHRRGRANRLCSTTAASRCTVSGDMARSELLSITSLRKGYARGGEWVPVFADGSPQALRCSVGNSSVIYRPMPLLPSGDCYPRKDRRDELLAPKTTPGPSAGQGPYIKQTAGGQGFEPRFSGPKPDVLPLDDPPRGPRSSHTRGRGVGSKARWRLRVSAGPWLQVPVHAGRSGRRV